MICASAFNAWKKQLQNAERNGRGGQLPSQTVLGVQRSLRQFEFQVLKFPSTRRNIKGRPFWSKVLSVRLNPTRKDTLYD